MSSPKRSFLLNELAFFLSLRLVLQKTLRIITDVNGVNKEKYYILFQPEVKVPIGLLSFLPLCNFDFVINGNRKQFIV